MITIYKTKHCSYCVMVAKYLTMKKQEFTEVYVDDDHDKRLELQKLTGATTVPITIKGDKWVIGYNIRQLNSLIQ